MAETGEADSSGAVETVIHETAWGPFQVVCRELTNDHKLDVYEVRFPGGAYARACNTRDEALAVAEQASSMWGLLGDALNTERSRSAPARASLAMLGFIIVQLMADVLIGAALAGLVRLPGG